MKQKGNPTADFQTSNSFYHSLTADSQAVVNEQAAISNPVIDSLDPAVFEVSAKKVSLMW